MPKPTPQKKTTRPTNKIILKIFDKKVTGEKRPHNCSICQAYKREIIKGNKDALNFYKEHINEWVRKYKGVTIVLDANKMPEALTAGIEE